MNGDFENDVYTVRVRLTYLIPELLPIRGKRARVYYHGIQQFCNTCYTPGHQRHECTAETPVSWNNYIESLRQTGIPSALFDPLDNSSSSNSSNLPTASTPRAPGSETITRAEFNSFLQELARGQGPNLNLSQNPVPVAPAVNPIPPTVNPIPPPRPVTRSRQSTLDSGIALNEEPVIVRGRGRGRPRARARGQSRGQPRGLPYSLGAFYDAREANISNQLFEDINNGRGVVRGSLRAQNHGFSRAPPQYYRGYRRG